jgi:hypothetical protein
MSGAATTRPSGDLDIRRHTFHFPNGWILGTVGLLIFGGTAYLTIQRGARLKESLDQETGRLRAANQREIERVKKVVMAADAGDPAALESLLARWHERRPESVQSVVVDISARPFSAGANDGATISWELSGHALRWQEIPSGVPRIGRGGRVVVDPRKAREIDEDLAELNAAAVMSLLIALFSGPTPLPVTVRLALPSPTTGEMVPWITLSAMIGYRELQKVCNPMSSAVEAIHLLGGDVGRCRNQRVTPATEPVAPARSPSGPGTLAGASPVPPSSARTRREPLLVVPPARTSSHLSKTAAARGPYGLRAAEVSFGEVKPSPQPAAGRAIPAAPPRLRSSGGPSGETPSPRNVSGEFSTIARKFAAYKGDPAARFVPFQAYYSTYSQMAAGQLKFYFKWRNAVRSGETPRTDLSYIFVHVYELLHLIGAENALNAGQQLERLWIGYRGTFPKLDNYLVHWITDLYATEVAQATALDFVQRAVDLGAGTGPDELLLITDKQWDGGKYAEMSNASLSLLVSDPRLGDNKFYRTNNTGSNGDSWVDRAYREAFAITDAFFLSQRGCTPREQTIATSGYRKISRVAFQGAVYDWKRKSVVLGKVAHISDTTPAVLAYRNAVRYGENLLRKERHFAAKLRGITIEPGLAQALDTHFATFIRSTRPKAKVTIDLSRARELAQESVDVRLRLLEGVDEGAIAATMASDLPPARAAAAPPAAESVPAESLVTTAPTPSEASAEHLAVGLLTDLAVVRTALSSLSAPARALVETLAAQGWESPREAPALKAATSGTLIRPLVDEINEHAVDAIGDVLIVTEGDNLVVQEDFRDEVHWVLNGSLDGFDEHSTAAAPSGGTVTPPSTASSSPQSREHPDTDGFGPVELRALAIISRGDASVGEELSAAATEQATTPLLLVDRINECALASSYGDILVDAGASPPVLIQDARDYVDELLDRIHSTFESSAAS